MARFSPEDNAVDIEPRDINFWFGAGARLYTFKEKKAPEVIRCPMFESIPHPTEQGKTIPVEWILPSDTVAQDIVADGSNIPEATPEVIRELDVEDDEKIELRKEIDKLGSQLEETHQALKGLLDRVGGTEVVHTPEVAAATEAEQASVEVLEEAQPPAREVAKQEKGKEHAIPIGTEMHVPATDDKPAHVLRYTERGWEEPQQYVPDKPSKAGGRKKAPVATTESPVTEEAPVVDPSASGEVSAEDKQVAANTNRREAAAKVTTSPRHPDTVIAPGGVGLGGPGRDKTDQALARRYMSPEPDLGAVPGGDSGHGTPEGGDAEAGGTPEEFLAAKAAKLTGESDGKGMG